MNKLLNPREFYEMTLKEHGVQPLTNDMEKVAEAKGISIEEAKLANAFFEQLQLDGVPYETHVQRREDALKIAHSYIEHVKEAEADAVKIADGLLRALEHAAEGFLSHNNIKLDARTAVKIAGLQAESADEYEKRGGVAYGMGHALGSAVGNVKSLGAIPGAFAAGVEHGMPPAPPPAPAPEQSWLGRQLTTANQGVKSVAQAANQGVRDLGSAAMTGAKETAMFPINYPYLAGAAGLGAMGLMAYRRNRDQAAADQAGAEAETTAPTA